jgi:hypothetical protein
MSKKEETLKYERLYRYSLYPALQLAHSVRLHHVHARIDLHSRVAAGRHG